jgi:type II restriction enzyme
MAGELAIAYKSNSQRARVVTEAWGENNLFCPNCSSPKLTRLSHNTKASDFSCPNCKFWYQLKGQQSRIGNSITDGAYEAMMNAIRNDETPNFYFMHYELATWSIRNLLLIPSFAFPPSAIVKRNPLAPTARRAGWIGCNIALNRIPVEARISIVTEKQIVPANEVRAQFQRVKPLKEIPVAKRGWMLDVLTAIRSLGKMEFTNQDIYALVPHFKKLYPNNDHITDKIRQQLQYLAKAGFLIHLARSEWRLK